MNNCCYKQNMNDFKEKKIDFLYNYMEILVQ